MHRKARACLVVSFCYLEWSIDEFWRRLTPPFFVICLLFRLSNHRRYFSYYFVRFIIFRNPLLEEFIVPVFCISILLPSQSCVFSSCNLYFSDANLFVLSIIIPEIGVSCAFAVASACICLILGSRTNKLCGFSHLFFLELCTLIVCVNWFSYLIYSWPSFNVSILMYYATTVYDWQRKWKIDYQSLVYKYYDFEEWILCVLFFWFT